MEEEVVMAEVMEEVVEEQEVEVEVVDMVMDEVEDMEEEDKRTVDITMMGRGTLTPQRNPRESSPKIQKQ